MAGRRGGGRCIRVDNHNDGVVVSNHRAIAYVPAGERGGRDGGHHRVIACALAGARGGRAGGHVEQRPQCLACAFDDALAARGSAIDSCKIDAGYECTDAGSYECTDTGAHVAANVNSGTDVHDWRVHALGSIAAIGSIAASDSQFDDANGRDAANEDASIWFQRSSRRASINLHAAT